MEKVKVSIGQFSPACTLKIRSSDGKIQMDIDLVPCFVFEDEQLPKEYKSKYDDVGKKETFFIVPKHPCKGSEKTNYWRLSFQKQERALLEGKERLKSALKLIKKLRDTQEQSKISSYFLKTITLLEIERHSEYFWSDKSLSYCFMKLLEAYRDRLEKKTIPYFWYEEFNLIETIKDSTLTNFYCRIKYIVDVINRSPGDKNVLEKYIIGKKVLNSPSHDEPHIQQNAPNDTAATIAAGVAIGATILSLGFAIFNKYRNTRNRDNNK